jgi:hypothetical protein
MSSVTRYEKTTTRVIFEVPCYSGYAAHAEVLKAISMARRELDPEWNGDKVSDDAVKVSPSDEAVLVWYEKKG